MTAETMAFPGEATRRIEQLESDVAFLARFIQLGKAGHATPPEFAYATELAARTERGSETDEDS